MASAPTESDQLLDQLLRQASPALLNQTGALVYAVSRDGMAVANRAVADLVALGSDPCGALPVLLDALYPDAGYRAEVLALHDDVMKTGRARDVRLLVTTHDGRQRHVWWTLTPMSTVEEGGDVLVAVGWDWTDRWRLQGWARLQAVLLGQAPTSLFVTDLDGRLLYWSATAGERLGATQPLERPLAGLLAHAEDVQRLQQALSLVCHGEVAALDVHLRDSDGARSIGYGLRVQPVKDANGAVVAAAFTQREGSDTPPAPPAVSLRGSDLPGGDEGLWAALHESSLLAVVITDDEGRIQQWNRGAQHLTGRTAVRVKGRLALVEDLVIPGLVWQDLTAQPASGGRLQREVRVLHAGGQERPAELEVCRLSSQEQGGWSLVLRDLSVRDGLREQLVLAKKAVLKATLVEGMVSGMQELTAVLSPSRPELDADLESLRRLARMATETDSWEQVQAYASSLGIGRLERRLDHALYEWGEGTWRLKRLEEDARLFLGQREAPRAISVDVVFDSALRLLEHRITGRCSVEVALAHLPPVRAQRGPLLRTFALLLLACIESCSVEGRSGGLVRVLGEQRGERICIRIQDDGDGYGVNIQSRLNDLPYLAEQAGFGCMALGLAREEARLGGGSLDLAGAPGTGTLVTLCLMGAQASAALQPLDLDMDSTRQRRMPVLVVEPDDLLRRAVERRLSAVFQVRTAATVGEVLTPVSEGRFAAAVVGLSHPEGLGLRLLGRLAEANPLLFRNTVILLPAGIRPATRDRLAASGAVLMERSTEPGLLVPLLQRLVSDLTR